jgi:NhaP-type Na+/H+ and K+/H+ antiporter
MNWILLGIVVGVTNAASLLVMAKLTALRARTVSKYEREVENTPPCFGVDHEL